MSCEKKWFVVSRAWSVHSKIEHLSFTGYLPLVASYPYGINKKAYTEKNASHNAYSVHLKKTMPCQLKKNNSTYKYV